MMTLLLAAGFVVGYAQIDTATTPVTVFEFAVHAHDDRGVVWIAHRGDTQMGWLVARVDCVRTHDRVGVVTAVVGAAHDVPAVRGDRIAVTVRDGATDRISVGPAAAPCDPGPAQERPVSRGDFRVQ
ncbi:hypothetical protein DMH04_51320 [Kibdelosporangium aridum]|uniref:Uncharacterized protein n=1 Tax=Kibdelosporangium aridum TaxID=2030 RepID=A0A428YAD4_KIBAR|nr:hypothetical protein [Kibdelosporangium aridum]RSM64480.1 hypothetical protein DMH04_51320 [Kibdelosporangium aridum]